MIYSNEQARLIKAKQKKEAEAKTADLKTRANDAAERAEIKKALEDMNAWSMDDLGVEA
jgi:hypothetical protein